VSNWKLHINLKRSLIATLQALIIGKLMNMPFDTLVLIAALGFISGQVYDFTKFRRSQR